MRDPKRIKRFCDELAEIWGNELPRLAVRATDLQGIFLFKIHSILKKISQCEFSRSSLKPRIELTKEAVS